MKTIRQAKPTTLNPASAHIATAQAKDSMTVHDAMHVKVKEKFNMRQHYKINPKPMPRWLETLYDCALAVIIGLLLSGALFEGLLK